MRIARHIGSMAVRLFVILVTGMIGSAVMAFAIAGHYRWELLTQKYQAQVADRVIDVVTRALYQPLANQPGPRPILPAAVRLSDFPVRNRVEDKDLSAMLTERFAGTAIGAVNVYLPVTGDCAPALPPPPLAAPKRPLETLSPKIDKKGPSDCRLVSIAITNGDSFAVMIPIPPPPIRQDAQDDMALFYVLVVAAVVLAWVVAAQATSPLRKFARAATALGEDLDRPPLLQEGPWEVQQVVVAFNAMQHKIHRALEERTFMLASITHDIQTPLTRQRLRIDQVQDPALREALLDDYAAMRDLVRDGLEIARGGMERTRLQPLDLASLLDSLCQDAQAAGQDVSVEESANATVLADASSLKRCLFNLVDNAVKFGHYARIHARTKFDLIEIEIRDGGPGIDTADLASATEPFVRLETGNGKLGSGLGLAIARLLAERNGSDLKLMNLHPRGLAAILSLRRTVDDKNQA